jgi:sugar lactone lactonase YvrE
MVKQLNCTVQRVLDVQNTLGESPVWSSDQQVLYWVDILEKKIWCCDPDGGNVRSWSLPFTVGSMGRCHDGRLVLATGQGFYLFSLTHGTLQLLGHPESHLMTNRFNDGKVSPEGRFWAGTMDDRADKHPVGSLYRLNHDMQIHKMAEGVKVSNGLAWSPDGTVMYHSCSRSEKIYSHEYDPITGQIGPRRLHVDVHSEWGRPDGAAVDRDGNYWSCGAGKGRINCFDASGQLIAYFVTPTPHPTMPCFGGRDLKSLYFTSSREGYTQDMLLQYPMAGDLFKVELDVAGVEVGLFRML